MRHLLAILAALLLCSAPLHAQTMKALMFNSTNGQVVANTGTNTLRFTNNISFQGGVLISDNGVFYGTNENHGLQFANQEFSIGGQAIFAYTTNVIETFVPIAFGDTNVVAATRANLGLGVTNSVRFGSILLYQNGEATNSITYGADELIFSQNGVTYFSLDGSSGGNVTFAKPISFIGTNSITSAATTRANLGLPLATLTNTSNVTMMRALSGSTNTNEPYSGSISVVGTNNTNTLVFSNGILQSVQ